MKLLAAVPAGAGEAAAQGLMTNWLHWNDVELNVAVRLNSLGELGRRCGLMLRRPGDRMG